MKKITALLANRTGITCLLVGLVATASPRPAEAKLLDVYAAARGGGVLGWGLNDINPEASDFFKTVHGPGMGAEIGIELLLLNASINFTQLFDTAGPAGTLTQFLLGFDGEIAVDGRKKPQTYLRLGLAGGAALGTHRPVDPPLDNRQVSDKGFVGQATVALDQHLGDVFSIGLEVIPGYHFFFAGGDAPANVGANQSHGMHVMALLSLRAHFEPFK